MAVYETMLLNLVCQLHRASLPVAIMTTTSATFSKHVRTALEQQNVPVHRRSNKQFELPEGSATDATKLDWHARWKNMLFKLNAWSLPYNRVVLIDCDQSFIETSIDDARWLLYSVTTPAACVNEVYKLEIDAQTTSRFWPDQYAYIIASLMVIAPSPSEELRMRQAFVDATASQETITTYFWEVEQSFLNMFYQREWTVLQKRFSATPSKAYMQLFIDSDGRDVPANIVFLHLASKRWDDKQLFDLAVRCPAFGRRRTLFERMLVLFNLLP